jgi:hypothetical protein
MHTCLSAYLFWVQQQGCVPATDDDNACSSDTVNVSSPAAFDASNGPNRFRNYSLMLLAIIVSGKRDYALCRHSITLQWMSIEQKWATFL